MSEHLRNAASSFPFFSLQMLFFISLFFMQVFSQMDCQIPRSAKVVMFFGKTGVGKSAVGNLLVNLKEPPFLSRMSAKYVTDESKGAKTIFGNQEYLIVDTPGLILIFFFKKMDRSF
jgi:GTP-binding protein EngB required for normal cell division